MKNLYTMIQLRSKVGAILIFGVLSGAAVLPGCSPATAPAQVALASCEANPSDLLAAIARDDGFRGYASEHFSKPRVIVLMDQVLPGSRACKKQGDPRFVFIRTSSGHDRSGGFIFVEKIYIDDDVAFLELGFPPTGKNGDALLRRKSGVWSVVQSRLWEN